ncbi:hypothetical protein Rcae01_00958 [Novipirellula caenicola]|uniref:Uncharacterized protein n=1 Tax=Novipirellula caenicola TaxID=1536901 RepID=A0ABP9VJZ1_9BACT
MCSKGQRCEEFRDGKLRHLHSVATLARAWMVASQNETPPSGEGSYEKTLHSVVKKGLNAKPIRPPQKTIQNIRGRR